MKAISLAGAGLALCILLSGCTTVKRYKSASYKGEENSLVDINLFSASLEDGKQQDRGKNLWDLSASAQTQLIQILHERYPENVNFVQALNHDYLLDGNGPQLDFTRKLLKMVFTISKTGDASLLGKGIYSPADRIEQLIFRLVIPGDAGIGFTGWNRYASEYGEIEVAEMSFDRSLEMEAQANSEMLEGVMKSGTSRSEAQVIRQGYLKMNGSLSGNMLEVKEESSRETDLAGNVIAEVNLEFEAMTEKVCVPLGDGLKFIDVLVPRMETVPNEISARLELEYIYRHVESGAKTFQEWDDRVAYYKGRVRREVSLFEREDFVPRIYGIGREEVTDARWIRVRTAEAVEYPLQFLEYDDAVAFFNFLANESGQLTEGSGGIHVGTNTLLYGDEPLKPGMLPEGGFKVMAVF